MGRSVAPPDLFFYRPRVSNRIMRIGHTMIRIAAAIVCVATARAAEFSLKTAEKPAPKQVSESIRAVLQPKSIQLVEGDKPALEIWLRQEVPLKAKPASASEALM